LKNVIILNLEERFPLKKAAYEMIGNYWSAHDSFYSHKKQLLLYSKRSWSTFRMYRQHWHAIVLGRTLRKLQILLTVRKYFSYLVQHACMKS
jgi:hypothetical protein